MKGNAMRKSLFTFATILFVLVLSAPVTFAQGAVKQGPDPSTLRDPELEKDSMHNLEVARMYFKLRKAYVAAIRRCEEIVAGNPTFAKMDEVLYIAAQSSLRLSENKGKQVSKDKTPEQLREDARDYLTQLVNGYPQSEFHKQAEDDLRAIGGPKEKTEKP
jgi:outer membrane protein assembly factor BamD (BamD/ComL family)